MNWPNKRSPNIADPGDGGPTEDTLSGIFAKMQADTPDRRPIRLINVDLLQTDELSLFSNLTTGKRNALA